MGVKGEGMKDVAGFVCQRTKLGSRAEGFYYRRGSASAFFANLLTKQRDLIIFKKGLTKTEHSNSRTKPVVED